MKTQHIFGFLIALVQSSGAATFAYDEATFGDLAENYLIPRVFTPGAGSSTLTGNISAGDRDLFTIVIGSGLRLDALYLINYDSPPQTPANVSYILSQPGAILTAPPSNDPIYAGGAIGYVGFGEWAEGRNILRFLTVGPPYDNLRTLGEGNYAFWINETGPPSDYVFRFDVSTIPEPSTTAFLSSALLFLSRRRRSRG